MHTIYCDGSLLYDPRVDELQISQTSLDLESGKTGGFSFTIYPAHPIYNHIKRFTSIIEVYHDAARIFRGRVLNDEVGFYNERRIVCEGELAYLNDSIMRPYDFSGTISAFLQMVITDHNLQVEVEKEFTLGSVTVIDANNTIARSSVEPGRSWTVLQEKLVGTLGGYLVVRRVGNINYLDYLADSDQMSLQEIKLGENLLDLQKHINGENVITALIPFGAKLLDIDGNPTEERLSIKSVNGGVDYVYDQVAVNVNGWIFDSAIWDDVTLAENLKAKAVAELTRRIYLNVSVELSAVDLSMMDANFDEFRIFEYVKVKSPVHQLDEYMLVSKLKIDLLNPSNNRLVLGAKYKTLTEKQVQIDGTIRNIRLTPGPRGQQGPQGVQGPSGPDGQALYTWIKYADTPTTGMADTPTNKAYIGLAYNKATSSETENYDDYSWSLIKGEIGPQGPMGPNGATLYTWIKYSASADGTNPTDDPVGAKYIGIAYNKPTSSESGIKTDYTWSLMEGPQGAQGVQGPAGRSITSVDVWYYLSTSPTALSGGTWATTAQAWASGKYIWSKTITTYSTGLPTESTPACVTGTQGQTGGTGATGTGVTSVSEEYAISESKTTAPTSFSATRPTWTSGMYIWTRSEIVYNNPTSTAYTTAIPSTEWEAVNDEEAARIADVNAKAAAAALDATNKANAAQAAAITAANAKAEAERVLAEAYADGIVDDEEAARIADVNAKATAAATDATNKANAAQAAAITAAATDATTKANAAKAAAITAANLKAEAETVISKAYADGIVDAEETARIADVNAKATAAATDATTKADAAKAAAQAYAVAQDALIQVGGRNLAASNLFGLGVTTTKEFELSVWAGELISATNTATMLVAGKQYTLSYDAEMVIRTTYPTLYSIQTGLILYSAEAGATLVGFYTPAMTTVGQKERVSTTFTCPTLTATHRFLAYTNRYTTNGGAPIGNDTVRFTNFKIEKGNKATDWTPAPEDDVAYVDDKAWEISQSLSSAIDQTNDAITSMVESTYTRKSEFTKYQTDISTKFTQTEDDFLFQFDKLTTDISTLSGDTKTTFKEWIKYIRFVNGNIELGESGNPIMLVIENDRISFKQSGVEVAYFSNNKFNVTDGIFKNSLRVGDFAFEPRTNGNVSFTKVV